MFDQIPKETEMDEIKSNNTSTNSITTSSDGETQPIKKTCSDCGTYKTPLWRGGPAGPKSLCNACGIRSRKRRRALLGLTETNQEEKITKPKKVTTASSRDRDENSGSSSSEISRECGGDEKMWCDDVIMKGLTWQRSTAGKKRRGRGVLGEEEQAAVLLMAMAYSSVLA